MSGEFKILIQDDTHGTLEASLLDYFFLVFVLISEHLLNDINNCTIQSGLHSDHSILKLDLNTDKCNRGKGFWKFNNDLLQYKDYVHLIKKTISELQKKPTPEYK